MMGCGRPGGLQQHISFQADSLTNSDFSSAEKIEEISTLANKSDDRKKENPGALAGASGAEAIEQKNSDAAYRLRQEWAIALRFAIDHCDPVDAALIMSDALERLRGGSPTPPLMNAVREAHEWAAWATPYEVKAYCLACFHAMPAKSQDGFLAHVMHERQRHV